jgi:hypothetical protein
VIGGFLLAGSAFMLAGAVAGVAGGVVGWGAGRWLALHLVFVGGISQLVLGASQFFAGAFLATDPPDRRLVRVQLVGWSLGSLLLAGGVLARSKPLIWLAVATLLAVLTVYAAALRQMRRRSLQAEPWATRAPARRRATRPRGAIDAVAPALAGRRDSAATGLGVTALAASQVLALDGVAGPAAVLLLLAYAVLAARIVQLAGGVLRHARPSL